MSWLTKGVRSWRGDAYRKERSVIFKVERVGVRGRAGLTTDE